MFASGVFFVKKLTDITQIHVLPYSHHDHAWTNSRQWHIWRYLEGYCLMLDRMAQDPQYTQVVDNVLHSLDLFYRYCPSRVEEFRQRVREGRISIANGGMALARPADFDGELLIRNGCEGRRVLMERFGLEDIPVYFNADTAVGASQMPQLLRLMGHRGYTFQRPDFTLNKKGVPLQFRWKGLDGSEILVSRGSYGGCLFANWDTLPKEDWPRLRDTFIAEELPEKLDNASSDVMMLHVGLDDCLPGVNIYDRPYDLSGFMAQWNAREGATMAYSTFNKLFEALSQRELPIWEGAVDTCELSYNAALRVDDSLRKLRLQTERQLLLCERLDAMACAMGACSQEATIRRLWHQFFEYAGHAMQHLLASDYTQALERARETLAALNLLQRQLLDEMACRTRCDSRVAQLVVNPTLNGGLRVVRLHITTPHHINGLVLRDSHGKELPWQLLEALNGDKPYDRQCNEVLVAVELDIPPMGWTTVHVECDHKTMDLSVPDQDAEGLIIDNGVFRAQVRNGMLCQLETDDGIITEGPLTMPRFYHTEPTSSWNVHWESIATDEFCVESTRLKANGPLRWAIETRGHIGNSQVILEQSIDAGNPVISYHMTLNNCYGEGYYTLAMPCSDTPELIAAVPFGEEPRHPEQELYHQPAEEYSLLKEERGWPYAFYAGGYVCAACGAGRLLFLQGDCSNLLRAVPHTGELEQHLYRSINMSTKTDWTKNMHENTAGRGIQHFEFAIAVLPQAHDGAVAQALLQTQRAPICACPRYTIESGTAPQRGTFLAISGTPVQLSAAYRQGDRLILRLTETGGEGGMLTLTLPEANTRVRAIDLTGRPLEKKIVIQGNKTLVSLHPYEICTLEIGGQ